MKQKLREETCKRVWPHRCQCQCRCPCQSRCQLIRECSDHQSCRSQCQHWCCSQSGLNLCQQNRAHYCAHWSLHVTSTIEKIPCNASYVPIVGWMHRTAFLRPSCSNCQLQTIIIISRAIRTPTDVLTSMRAMSPATRQQKLSRKSIVTTR